MEIRDPIHGPIRISEAERIVLDHRLVQRLRRVKQLGFAEYTFPGATHTRLLHSLGTMHIAGLAFDAIATELSFVPPSDIVRIRATLRLAALLHDLGHTPMSHGGAPMLPEAREIGHDANRRATHEEMAEHLIFNSDLAGLIEDSFRNEGVRPEHVVALLGGVIGEEAFLFGGITLVPLLAQLIAGEVDADRMDYLHRDSYFTGVSYGNFDREWILSHLGVICDGGVAHLAIDSNAVHAVEDLLLSRHHMFLMVYTHPRTLAYHRMLAHFLENSGLRVPTNPAEFSDCDDEWLRSAIHFSSDPWAKRIAEKRPLKPAVEVWDEDARRLEARREELLASLPHGVEWIDTSFEFSRYFRSRSEDCAHPLLVRIRYPVPRRRVVPIEEYSGLFGRYAQGRYVVRLYCEPDLAATVSAVVEGYLGGAGNG